MVSFYYYYTVCFKEISVFNANSVDPDQMPHSAASDLCLHCLSIALLWVFITLDNRGIPLFFFSYFFIKTYENLQIDLISPY